MIDEKTSKQIDRAIGIEEKEISKYLSDDSGPSDEIKKFDELLDMMATNREVRMKRNTVTNKTKKGFAEVANDVEMPKEGGMLAHIGQEFPIKGIPWKDKVYGVGAMKRLARLTLNHAYKKLIRKHRPPVNEMSNVSREIYRVFNVMIERENSPRMKDMWLKIRDIICMVLEYDNAYRFRFQDFFEEIDHSQIKFDEGDIFWTDKRRKDGNYNYRGLDENWGNPDKGRNNSQ